MSESPAAGSGPLGNTAKLVSPPSPQEKREKRFVFQSLAAKLLPDMRVSHCMHDLKDKGKNVEIRYNAESKKAHVHNVQTCGSVWVCAVCGQKIAMERRGEVLEAIEAGLKLGPLTLFHVAFTEQHELSDPLEDLLKDLLFSTSKLQSGNPWLKIKKKYGLYASVSRLEVTFGLETGWHPHKHVLFFSNLDTSKMSKAEKEALAKEFENALGERWTRIMSRRGRYASPIYGVKVGIFDVGTEEGKSKAAQYVTKGGKTVDELASLDTKEGKRSDRFSPWQLLEKYQVGQKWAGVRFQEYAKATKGRNWMVWSRGAKDLFGLKDKTDEEIASSEENGESEVLLSLSYLQYKRVLNWRTKRPGIIGQLLTVADRGDPWEVWQFLIPLGVRPTGDQLDKALFYKCNTS